MFLLIAPLFGGTTMGEPDKRFQTAGNGTVVDGLTGLIWLQNSTLIEATQLDAAGALCATLCDGAFEELRDGSKPGDWRLPTYHELLTLSDLGVQGVALAHDHPFVFPKGGGARAKRKFWSSTAGQYDKERSWTVEFSGSRYAASHFVASVEQAYVWPVRGKLHTPLPQGQATKLSPDDWPQLTPSEQIRAERNALWDFKGLRSHDGFVSVEHGDFLDAPSTLTNWYDANSYSVAKTAGRIKLRILPNLEPEYFPAGRAYSAGWANWAKITHVPDDRFFMAASDHRGQGAGINIYEYRLRDDKLQRVVDVRKALGWSDTQYTDGKIHGYMGVMPDGTLWAATHRGPKPDDEWYAAGYRGSWLLSYHIDTGETHNWGVPLVGNSLPYFSLDTERGHFFGSGENKTLLCWDVKNKTTRFAGYPPNGWDWYQVSVQLHDPQTGFFWGVDVSEEPYRFMSYDPTLNRFERHELEVPRNPANGVQGMLLHNTPKPDSEGWFYCFASAKGGILFRFRPRGSNGPEAEFLAVTTGEAGCSAHQLEFDPSGRFVYYAPRRRDGLVVVQYEIATRKQKILGFFSEAIFKEFGYWSGNGIYGLNVSQDGSNLLMLDDGAFAGRGNSFGGHPALLVLAIPASER